MTIVVYVPCDAAALALGADEVADAIVAAAVECGLETKLVRNGSRGLFWLEPLVEVVTTQGRITYGPVTEADVPGLFAAGFTTGGDHSLRLGNIETLPFPVFAGGMEPLFRPVSNGSPYLRPQLRRNILFATPMRAIPVLFPIACNRTRL